MHVHANHTGDSLVLWLLWLSFVSLYRCTGSWKEKMILITKTRQINGIFKVFFWLTVRCAASSSWSIKVIRFLSSLPRSPVEWIKNNIHKLLWGFLSGRDSDNRLKLGRGDVPFSEASFWSNRVHYF